MHNDWLAAFRPGARGSHHGAMGLSTASVAALVLDRLDRWPEVHVAHATCGSGVGVAVRRHELLRLHDDREAELCLTGAVIERMGATLSANPQVRLPAQGDWVSVQLDTWWDADLLLTLLSVAIKAHLAPEEERKTTDS
jgi:hypothetical protein